MFLFSDNLSNSKNLYLLLSLFDQHEGLMKQSKVSIQAFSHRQT